MTYLDNIVLERGLLLKERIYFFRSWPHTEKWCNNGNERVISPAADTAPIHLQISEESASTLMQHHNIAMKLLQLSLKGFISTTLMLDEET